MNIDRLYAELGVDFQPNDRQMFLQELADVAHSYKTQLGSKAQAGEDSDHLLELTSELGKEVAEFSPKLSVLPLKKTLFTDLKLEMPPYTVNLLKRFNFYLVDFPITLFPRPGWGFVRLECRVEFNPGRPSAERPIAYQIFPHEEWQDILHAWQSLAVGLDENFEFKIDSAQLPEQQLNLNVPAKAAIELKMAGKMGLILGPFNYYVRRPKILSQGRGNVKVMWRLEGEEQIMQTEPRLGVVLQVPKHVSRVDAIGAMAVFRTFHFFTAELGDLLDFLSKPTKNFLENGAPATDKKPWDDITAGT